MKNLITLISFCGSLVAARSQNLYSTAKAAPTCEDGAARFIAGKFHNSSIQTMLLRDCKSFLATTVAPTVSMATHTSTVTFINNNKLHNPTAPPYIKPSMVNNNGIWTIVPTQVPHYGSWDGFNSSNTYTSACKCVGAAAKTVTDATATVTAVEYLPTTFSTFKLKAVFGNGTMQNIELAPNDLMQPKSLEKDQVPWTAHVTSASTSTSLFSLDPTGRLRFENQGLLSASEAYVHDRSLLYFIPSEILTHQPWEFFISSQNLLNTTEFRLHAHIPSANPVVGAFSFVVLDRFDVQVDDCAHKHHPSLCYNPQRYDWIAIQAEPQY